MRQLSDFTLISDIDGTLLTHEGIIPQRNIEAIHRFVEQGGHFSVATGRSRGFALDVVKDLPINLPCVVCNGSMLYDLQKQQMLMELFLPDTAKSYVKEMIQEMPQIGVMMVSNDDYDVIHMEETLMARITSPSPQRIHDQTMDENTKDPYKIIFYVDSKDREDFMTYLQGKNYPDVRFVASHHNLVEMLPQQSSKGFALEKMIDMGLTTRENLVAIGDYYNDLEMILFAGIGVTLNDAPEDLREVADLVVGGCDQGAVADVIEHLERLCASSPE